MTDPYGNKVRDILRPGPPKNPSAISRPGKTLRDRHRGSLKMGGDGREYIQTNQGWQPVTFLDESGNPTAPQPDRKEGFDAASMERLREAQSRFVDYSYENSLRPHAKFLEDRGGRQSAPPPPSDSQRQDNSMCRALRVSYDSSRKRESQIRTEIKYNPGTRDAARARLDQELARQDQLLSQMQSLGCQ